MKRNKWPNTKPKKTNSRKKEYRVSLSPGEDTPGKRSAIVKGTPVKIKGYPRISFFARKGNVAPSYEEISKEKDKMWILSEKTTGLIIFKGARTKKALIEGATEFLHKTITEDNLLKKLEGRPKLNK